MIGWIRNILARKAAPSSAPHLAIALDPTRPAGTLATQTAPEAQQPTVESENRMSTSALQTIETDVEKFFKGTATDAEKFGTAFEKCFAKLPSAEQTIQNFINEAAPVITAAVSLADPIAEPAVAGALAVAETGLAAIQAAATAATSGTSLLANLQNFATTVPSLLTGLAIKNPALKAAIERIVALVTGEAKVLIPAVQAWVKQLTPAPEAPPAA